MTEQQVVELMESSDSEAEWGVNADKVKSACGGYPPFWFAAIVQSGVMAITTAKWGRDDQIYIEVFDWS